MTSATDRSVYPITWVYEEGDPGLMLWTAALDAWQMRLPRDAKVLELGCAETDWLERLHRFNPTYTLTGVDARRHERGGGPNMTVLEGDACRPELFEPESFDAIVMLGALEHFGMGFYGDPVHQRQNEDVGDMLAMVNVARWLKPRGWTYFDVPCNPTGRIAANRHFRTFSPSEIVPRLLAPGRLREVARGYSLPEPNAGTWVDEPTEERVPYWYVAVLAEKG